jgi:hypothetical protein
MRSAPVVCDPRMDVEGQYFDGRSAQRRSVRLLLGPDGLEIHDGDGVDTWPYDRLRRQRQGSVAQIQRREETARLAVSDAAFLDALAERCSDFDRTRMPWRQVALIAVAAVAVGALAFGAVQLFPKVGARLLPIAWEENLGGKIIDIVAVIFSHGQQPRFCDGSEGTRAIDGLVGRLTAGLDTPYRMRVRVLNSKDVNAFAAPGGYIVVLSGLIDFAVSPDELAGVVAHEIGHVLHRHPTQAMLRQINEARLFGFMTGNASGGGAISTIADATLGASYSREAETQADATAFALLSRARISPQGMAAFFDRLIAQGKSGKGTILASHPADETRSRRARESASQLRNAAPALSDGDWRAVKGICGS